MIKYLIEKEFKQMLRNSFCHQLLHNERTEQLHGHLLGHAALVDLQFRADNDDASAGVVHPLAQQVLTCLLYTSRCV